MSREEWILASVAFATCVLTVPVVRVAALKLDLCHRPGALDIHKTPVPRLGGIAISISILAGILSSIQQWPASVVMFGASLLLIWLGGLVDDLRTLSPATRLGLQALATALLWSAGWHLQLVRITPLDFAIQCLVVLAFVNALNFLDGADGIASGVTAVIAFGYLTTSGPGTSRLGSAVASSVIGSCLGFLLFNFPPARIFMGDSGSTVLGFSIAFLSLDYYQAGNASGHRLLVPLLLAGLPLADTGLAVLRRVRNGVSVLEGDRRHFFDLLLQRGWSPRRVTLFCYVITSIFVFLAHLCQTSNWLVSASIVVVLAAAMLLAAMSLGSLRLE